MFRTDFRVDFPYDPHELFIYALIGWEPVSWHFVSSLDQYWLLKSGLSVAYRVHFLYCVTGSMYCLCGKTKELVHSFKRSKSHCCYSSQFTLAVSLGRNEQQTTLVLPNFCFLNYSIRPVVLSIRLWFRFSSQPCTSRRAWDSSWYQPWRLDNKLWACSPTSPGWAMIWRRNSLQLFLNGPMNTAIFL